MRVEGFSSLRAARVAQVDGYKTWYDEDDMEGNLLTAMSGAVEGADAVVVALSKGYKESQACRTEAEYVLCPSATVTQCGGKLRSDTHTQPRDDARELQIRI